MTAPSTACVARSALAPPVTTWVRATAAMAAAIGVAAMIGWIFDVDTLRRVAPTFVVMKFNTAVCLTLLGTAWLAPRRAAIVAAWATAVIAGVSLLEYAARVSLGIDQLVFTDTTVRSYPGRMAVETGICLILLSASRLTLLTNRPHATAWAAWTSGTSLAVSGVALFGYLYGARTLYAIGPYSTIALHTAIALQLLGIAALASIPDGLVPRAVRGSDAGGLLLRRLLPVALLGIPALGFLRALSDHEHRYNTPFGLAVLVMAASLLVAGVTWVASEELSRVDARRLQAIADLEQLTDELERRVEMRVEQVEEHNVRIAVLEERERISADLHDVIVQQLFAAGIQLQGIDELGDRAAIRRRADASIDAFDHAISDLRNSIQRLKPDRHRDDLRAEIIRAVNDAELLLGYRPTLEFAGSVERAATAGDDIIAALREALTNVVRHAQATQVSVRLAAEDGEIHLTISDNGIGIGVNRASGTRSMRLRAQQHDGTCRWLRGSPSGTLVEWWIPDPAD